MGSVDINLKYLVVEDFAAMRKVMEAAQAGVNGYIVKPFTPEILKEKLELIFNRLNRLAEAS